MPGHRPRKAKFRRITCLALSWLICGPALPALADMVPFQQLLPFVNIQIPGWAMQGKPSGTTLNQGQMKVSEARVSFKAGDQTLEIAIMDFLGKPIPFLIWQNMAIETSEETLRTTEVQGFQALESYRSKDKQGELDISVANRFWVKIDGEGIDGLKVLKDAAQQMDLKKLATLAQ